MRIQIPNNNKIKEIKVPVTSQLYFYNMYPRKKNSSSKLKSTYENF